MKIIILSSSFSGLTQRVYRELDVMGHQLLQHYDLKPDLLRDEIKSFKPDVIICPFLTQRIPEDVWQNNLCLVVHPGIEGDRGASSLDWAIMDNWSYWGVTLLEAVEEMDAGDIWGTREFPMRDAGKTSIYKREVSTAAVELIKEALHNMPKFKSGKFTPRPLDYANDHVKGQLRDFCRQVNRQIDWQHDTTSSIVRTINAADTSPGVVTEIHQQPMHVFGAKADLQRKGNPGELIGFHKGSVLVGTKDGAVWIQQMKTKHGSVPPIKLAATVVINDLLPELTLEHIQPDENERLPIEDIWVEHDGDIAYLYFNFYNGAFNTQQCQALTHTLRELKASDSKIIVFMGGEDFWGNGIHLNCIEAADDPAMESWLNINAIDDLVYEMIDCPNQLTVAALRNNAGAGGAIMALACDEVIIREGAVLNPHYKNMGLFGSEYWTYLLPKKVGGQQAQNIINACEPMLASEAIAMNYADMLLPEDWAEFHSQLVAHCQSLLQDDLQKRLETKRSERAYDESMKPLKDYRAAELLEMKKIFNNAQSEYHAARHAFVYKLDRENKDDIGHIELAATA